MPPEVTQPEVAEKPAPAAPEGAQAAPETQPEAKAAPEKASAPEGAEKGTKQGEDAAPKTALEAAKRVMAKEGKAASDAKPQEGEPSPEKGAAEKVATDEEDANLPFKDDPRWKKMSSENRILTVARGKNEEAIKALEPKAKAHDDLIGYFTANNLNQQDVASSLTIMAAVRNDPAKAYELLKPVMEQLETQVGVRLPADVQAKVVSGQIDQETAQELAKSRAAAELAEQRRAASEERRSTREQQEREQGEEAQMNVIVSTLNSAETEWARSDPDAVRLKPLLNDTLLVEGAKNPPRNGEEARELFNHSLELVKKRVHGFSPAPREKPGVLPVGGASKPVAQVPKNALEAAQAALAAMGR